MSNRDELMRMAVKRHFVEWAYNEKVENALCLGPAYDQKVDELIEKIAAARSLVESVLATFPDHELRFAAGLDGARLGVDLERNLMGSIEAARDSIPGHSRFEWISIGVYPDSLADYEYWAMRDTIPIQDLVLLSIGLEPSATLRSYFEGAAARSEKFDPVLVKTCDRRLELMRTAQMLNPMIESKNIDVVYEWLNTVELPVPIGFRNFLEKGWQRLRPASVEPESTVDSERFENSDPRELRSLARLLTAIAIEEYGYQPSALRSPIPKEMESICDRQGLSVTRETILKFLRLGANLQEK